MKKYFPGLFLLLLLNLFSGLIEAQSPLTKMKKLVDFELQSSALVRGTGEELSSETYNNKDYWFPVKVPTTVLRGLVDNGIYPSPYFGLNNMLIPDASDAFNKQYNLEQFSFIPGEPNPWKKPYWYKTHFRVPEGDKGKTFQLIFKGINYRAAVWLNGKQVADSSQMAGMFAEHNLEVSSFIEAGKENYLAVKIYPLDFPGLPSEEQLKAFGPFFDNGGPNGDIGKNVTMLCSDGWDWMPPVRDRNMGIWQPVYLRTNGAITFGRVQVKTILNLPDTSSAKIQIGFNLTNHGSNNQSGQVKIRIRPENFLGAKEILITQSYSVPAQGSLQVELGPEKIASLLFSHPQLWWPNNYGKANLYRIHLQFLEGKGISDDTSFCFGVRSTESRTSEVNGFTRREFFVNGQKIHLVGGAWVPDMLVNRDSARYERELELCRNANVNLVRIWGGGITPPDAFWESADRNGLLVWSDFWVTGDTQGEFKGSPDYPLESSVFIKNALSTILRIRNHPSLLVWTGGNEGHARKELYDAMRSNIIRLDGTRPFIPSSSGFAKLPSGWDGSYPDNKPSGVYSGGPYSWQDPGKYFQLADAQKDWVFKDETGIPSQPPFTTLPKIITNLVWDKTLPYPLNNSWAYHDACAGNGHYDLYYYEMVRRFGAPTSMEDFSNKMQIMNAIGYQGIFEAANHKIQETGGVMLWKLNAALPSVIWQIYDWYLEPNAGYFFMQNACEPIHVQFNRNDSTIALINRGHKPTGTIRVQTQIWDQNSKKVYEKTERANVKDMGAQELNPVGSVLKSAKGIRFVVLDAKNESGKLLSHNAYWFSADTNYTGLMKLKATEVETQVLNSSSKQGNKYINLRISNKTEALAFFVRPQLMQDEEEIMPCYWSASYFTLAPGQSMEVQVRAGLDVLGNKKTKLVISGLNVTKREIAIP